MESVQGNKEPDSWYKNKFFIATIIALVLVVSGTVIAMQKTVTITEEGTPMEVKTFATTVGSLLSKQGIEVEERDHVMPGLDERLRDGDEIVIKRAFQVEIIDGEDTKKVYTLEETIEEILASNEIEINELDLVEPNITEAVSAGDVISITRVEKDIITEAEEIPYRTVTRNTGVLEQGKTRKVQDGQPGLKELKYEVVYENGEEVSRELISEVYIEKAVEEIIEKGTAGVVMTSRGDNRRYSRVLTMNATAYTAGPESTGKSPGDPGYGITSTGSRVRPGVVAVDPNVIPLGSRLYIESMDGKTSYGIAYAEDTGGAIRGNKIDIYYEDLNRARSFGRRNVRVYVLR
ncbi:G5 domain-containing protein [Serpentinicella sp. ANB-PHB4]|uniref:G5 domain-containing protein n=1 Tax=Serpentinicella sp. ANB-PHB4 TaxID=3074076 RepID=UPI00285E0167|nr:G5 domain-containing protein [Serpentinicella sp. ANB-PHB4]MDR5659204.1 G5 domain-containing protein [Serpentinicella sp. ANB-PHB4]